MSDPIKRLVQRLARLPGIGEKTATRLAFHIATGPAAHAKELADALNELVERVRFCSVCMNFTEADPCELCNDSRRDARTICVVSNPADLVAIRSASEFQGRFHVLHGLLSPLEGIGPEDLRIAELIRRLDGSVEEVILATNASIEGEATAMYLARLAKPLGLAVTRIASGIPVGGELEYSDRATIARALAGRSPL
jgi:recombination protein RecR